MKVLTSKLKFNRLAQCIALMRDHDDFVVDIPSGVIRDIATIAEFSKDTFQEGIEATLTEWEWWIFNSWVDNDLRKLAYILATDYHERAWPPCSRSKRKAATLTL